MATGRFSFVTWDGGGNLSPALALARRLFRRGHSVHMLAPRTLQTRIEETGSAFASFPDELEWDDRKGRALEDQLEFWTGILCAMPLADAVLAETHDARPDVIVVDCMLGNALAAAERSGLPTAALVHVLYQPWASMEEPRAGWWQEEFECMNDTRAALGLAPIPRQRFLADLWSRPARTLVCVPRELDRTGNLPSANVVYVGPLLDDEDSAYRWDLPWEADDARPLILITLSTTYQHQEDLLQRLLAAVSTIPSIALLTLGHGIRADELDVPDNIVLRDWIPHRPILRHTAVVVTHAGLGTVSASLTHGVPLVCVPLGREQANNAAQVEACGAGIMLPEDAGAEQIRDAINDVLRSDRFRAGAGRMSEIIAGYGDGARAVQDLEALLSGR